MAKRNIVITGGAGFIGSHVVRLFVNKYPEYNIICLDKLTYAGNLANLKDLEDKPNYKFVRMDICDFEGVYQLMQDERIDGIIHLAAESHVDRSIKDPFTFAQTNVMGTLSLLQAAKLYWEQFHYVIPIRPADHLLQNNLRFASPSHRCQTDLLAVRIHRMHTYRSRPLEPRAANQFEFNISAATYNLLDDIYKYDKSRYSIVFQSDAYH